MNDNAATKQDLQDFEARIAAKFSDTATQFEGMQGQLVRLTELVTAGFETVTERFDRLESRIDKLEDRVSELKKRLGKVEVRIDGVEARFVEIKLPLRMIEREQRQANDWLGRMDGRLEAVENDIKEIYDFIAQVRRTFALQLKQQPEQEKRLKRLEIFADSAARQIGVKFP